jgi:hypothetical protein
MSRERNKWQRHIEDCLAERREMQEWIRQAQALTPFILVTAQDWLRHGHRSPWEWLCIAEAEEHDPWDDWDWDDDPWDDEELDDQDEDEDWRLLQQDWEDYWEPPDLEYGGQHYPAEHVREARELSGGGD